MLKIAGLVGAAVFLIGGVQTVNAVDMEYERTLGLGVSGQVEPWPSYMF